MDIALLKVKHVNLFVFFLSFLLFHLAAKLCVYDIAFCCICCCCSCLFFITSITAAMHKLPRNRFIHTNWKALTTYQDKMDYLRESRLGILWPHLFVLKSFRLLITCWIISNHDHVIIWVYSIDVFAQAIRKEHVLAYCTDHNIRFCLICKCLHSRNLKWQV